MRVDPWCIRGITAYYPEGPQRVCYGSRAEAVLFWGEICGLSPASRVILYETLGSLEDHREALVAAGRAIRSMRQ